MDQNTVEQELNRRKNNIARIIKKLGLKGVSLTAIHRIAEALVNEGYVDDKATGEVIRTLDRALDIACSPDLQGGELTDSQKTERNLKREECIKQACKELRID
ncbi:MAG: hypothetical protein LUD27_01880 [Clostridia bacterium]|nr:hypothetical protein [Clostridia bacterium]